MNPWWCTNWVWYVVWNFLAQVPLFLFGGQVKPKLHMPPMPIDLEASEESCFGQMSNVYDGSKGGDNRTTMSNYKLDHLPNIAIDHPIWV